MTIVSVHQPNFLPWSKLLAKIVLSDIYVAYDSVQFNKREYHARQRFPARDGQVVFLSVPVRHTGRREILRDMRIVESEPWRARHLEFIDRTYADAPYYDQVRPVIAEVYAAGHEFLVDHNVALVQALCRYLGSSVRTVRASTLPHAGSREERLLDLVRAAGGDAHLSSTSATHHIDWSTFHAAGIPVLMQEFVEPTRVWPVPGLSVVDLLFHRGRAALDVLRAASALTAVLGHEAGARA